MTSASILTRSFPTLRYVVAPVRWVAQTRRRRAVAALVLLAMVAVPYAWWRMQLFGLPDIGDRILPGPSRSPAIPVDRDAMVLYRLAHERYRTAGKASSGPLDMFAPWSETPEGLRREVEVNGESLDLYRRAADRPEAGPAPAGLHLGSSMLHWLALLEASRLEERGDMAGAWTWYRALLRTVHHESAFTTYNGRFNAQGRHARIRTRLETWAADRRTTPEVLRRALDDAIAFRSIPPPSDAYTLAAECTPSDGREGKVNSAKWGAIFGIPEDYFSPEQQQAIYDLWRVWHREPERSRRIIRLAVANWRAYEATPTAWQPPADAGVTGPYDFYALGDDAPAGARALSPVRLDRWLETSPEARQFLDHWRMERRFLLRVGTFQALHTAERVNDGAVLLLLATELYRRDHGTDPPSERALIGPYLKELPDQGDAEPEPRSR